MISCFFKTSLLAFFGAKDVMDASRKGSILVAANIAFRWFEWIMTAATLVFFGFLKHNDVSNVLIFFFFWLGNTVIARFVIFISDTSDIDITLMKGVSRCYELLRGRVMTFGLAMEAMTVIFHLFMSCPSQTFFLLKRNAFVEKHMWLVISLASAIQVSVWMFLFSIGYDSLMKFS